MKGYVTILAALVLLAVTGGIAFTLTTVSIDALEAGEALRQGEQALFFSDACLEEGMLQIIRDPATTGKNIQMPTGSCEISIEKSSDEYTINAVGKNGAFRRAIEAKASLGVTQLNITSWKEK